MSALDNLSWIFPVTEMSQYMREDLALFMPIIVTVLGVLIALIVVEGFTDIFLRIGFFIVGNHRYGGIGSADFDIDVGIPIGEGRRLRGNGLVFDLPTEDYEVDGD